MTAIHPMALFRLSVLGPLASRKELDRGELNAILESIASQTYDIPGSKRVHLSRQTIQKWYYDFKCGGVYALEPKLRSDKNKCQLPENIQEAILSAKRDNHSRSIKTIIGMLENTGMVAKGSLSKATVHRFLRVHELSRRSKSSADTIERRSFVAARACDLWQGDVLHGPSIITETGLRKTYLVSLLDDASRLICHSAFCFGETALDIEGVLKQALLKRGLPLKLVVDNGAAYRSGSLQGICARLKIQLVYCRAYEPEAKGKLERYHRTFREQFLNEIHAHKITNLADLNARLWAWVEHIYHQNPHGGLDGKTPLARYREDLAHITQLSIRTNALDEIFYHRDKRKVRKDGAVQWDGQMYEVPHHYVGETIILVIDPHIQKALYIESAEGKRLASVTLLNKASNLNRKRQRPDVMVQPDLPHMMDAVEHAFTKYNTQLQLSTVPEINLTNITE